jgi:DNA-binding SARP family transcriptional activator/TolB-like protein
VDAGVVAGVESAVGSAGPGSNAGGGSVEVRMLGPLTVRRDGVELALPSSRKVRALIAYLALAPRAVGRSALCELLWDAPGDPRGELRWCLSKARSLLDEDDRRRVVAQEDSIRLDLSDCRVDAIEVARAMQEGVERLAPARTSELLALCRGDFLDGLALDDAPAFDGWLAAQRRRFRGCHTALLERRVDTAADEAALALLDEWLQLAPFDRRAHELLLVALARRGRVRDAEEHLATTVARFEAEGLDCTPIREAWRSARAQGARPAHLQVAGPASTLDARPDPLVPTAARRASIAVMPFLDLSTGPSADRSTATSAGGGAGAALAHDVITRLAKLRSLFVIAQGTVFALHERRIDAERAGRMLNVDYVVSGTVRFGGRRLSVAVELAEARNGRILWAETFTRTPDDAFLVLEEIGNRIVACIASEIEAVERNRAILKPPNSLDAWEAHHRGLWHMYRFDQRDNERARHFFDVAVRLDPTFAPAHAGLSFTHFQSAFQGWGPREAEIALAFETAGQSLMADERDPAAHWAMGRALWLRGAHSESVVELRRTVELSPNFALGHYALAFVQSQAGDATAAISSSDHSRDLSPGDPLLFGMLGARAMALVRLGRFDEAADWAVRAAARPNAHAHIFAIAACALALSGRLDEARATVAAIRRRHPRYALADFIDAFRFDADGAALFCRGAELVGLA